MTTEEKEAAARQFLQRCRKTKKDAEASIEAAVLAAYEDIREELGIIPVDISLLQKNLTNPSGDNTEAIISVDLEFKI